ASWSCPEMAPVVSHPPLDPVIAAELDRMIAAEPPSYMAYLLGFTGENSLTQQVARAREDRFTAILDGDAVAGFFCLRGFDAGYARPSFGIYVASHHQGRGLAKASMAEAISQARRAGADSILIKCHADNVSALKVYTDAGAVFTGLCPDTGQNTYDLPIRP
ncbi:MAG: GNAT family N-acetyltransferase, partial [Pseudomonadota bacterium]